MPSSAVFCSAWGWTVWGNAMRQPARHSRISWRTGSLYGLKVVLNGTPALILRRCCHVPLIAIFGPSEVCSGHGGVMRQPARRSRRPQRSVASAVGWGRSPGTSPIHPLGHPVAQPLSIFRFVEAESVTGGVANVVALASSYVSGY